jgi:predicted nucleic acid-binding protein
MDNIYLDTDVILDLITDREPFSEQIATIFQMAEGQNLKVYISPLSLSNAYYILRKVATHKKILEVFQHLMKIVKISSINENVVERAVYSVFSDFEDALQNFSAENSPGIKLILTRNVKDYKHSSLAVMTPEMYLKSVAER